MNRSMQSGALALFICIVAARGETCFPGDHMEDSAYSSFLQTAIKTDERDPKHPSAVATIVPDEPLLHSTWEVLAAGAWMAILGSLPFTCAYVQGEQLTRSRKLAGCMVTAWVLTCGVLFTSAIYCESAHYTGARHLTLIETVYFMTQILTTIGYGDIWPAFPSGQIATAFLILCAIFIVADAIGQLTGLVFSKLEAAANDENADPVKQQVKALGRALLVHFALCAVGVAFDMLVLSWTFEQAFLQSIVTLTTVGLGENTTGSRTGQLFLSFWMLFGTASLANVVGAFGGLMSAIKDAETSKKQFSVFG
eukprot:TRINITY_DN3610_c0_g1_i2.p1 TRINITY_DN3610_c0_g1~~TRINITY_DN3610_c0_g1_i2.p1  ORF type:complete len:333 (-),score=53.45 TRINITY_DN3610_c0_g1_i2:90-1016(-)